MLSTKTNLNKKPICDDEKIVKIVKKNNNNSDALEGVIEAGAEQDFGGH